MAENQDLFSKVTLPSSITVSTFSAARIKEVQAMKKAIRDTTGVKMAFQRLPRHMRRRAMSHNVKRLPRRLQEVHLSQMKKSGLPPKKNRPSRKYRRRQTNLFLPTRHTKRKIKWLETHIWHAKRFHMIEKWGYKLPEKPCDKSFRACFRATTKHCLVQDISYFQCLEFNGPYETIVESLSVFTDSTTGLGFGAKCFSEGKKYGTTVLHEPDGNRRALGQVEFLWSVTDKIPVLWMFLHPAIIISFEKCLNEKNFSGFQWQILSLGRFRLTGPLSTAVIKKALRVFKLDPATKNFPAWCNQFSLQQLKLQNEVFQELTDCSLMAPNLVLSIIIQDPRMNFPKKRTKSTMEQRVQDNEDIFERLKGHLALSPLVSKDVRDVILDTKLTNSTIYEMRSQHLVPGSDLSEMGQPVPLILLWRPGKRDEDNLGYASGWDIIVPSGWCQPVFISLIMWGARAGGLRETESIAFEGTQRDILPPDSAAGEAEEAEFSRNFVETYFKKPPKKRTNYAKFGIVSPSSFKWTLLLKDWNSDCSNFSVLRNLTLLKSVQDYLFSKSQSFHPLPNNTLIPVQVTPLKRGRCSRFTLICVPKMADFKIIPTEPLRKDFNSQKRRHLRKNHQVLLKRLRNRRRRAKALGKGVKAPPSYLEYRDKMRELWMPSPQSIKSSCSRDIMGFIKKGDFSFSLGKSKGLGYITARSLECLKELQTKNRVLIRNTNSRRYQMATLDIITS